MALFRKVLLFSVVLLLWSHGFSQNRRLQFERISLREGLSQNTITSIMQDAEGYLWFATLDGLNKYDGYRFTVYEHVPADTNSLSANTVWALAQDKSGYIWIGTVVSGLNRFDPATETFRRFVHDPEDSTSLSGNRIRAIYEDRDGFLWVGTRDNGLNRYDPVSGKFTRYRHDPSDPNSLSHNHVRTIISDEDGVIWIGTAGGGLNRFDPKTETWMRFGIEPNNPRSLNHNRVESLCLDSQGVLWVGTYGGGLNRLLHLGTMPDDQEPMNGDVRPAEFIHYTHDDDDPTSISGDVIECIFEDHTGVLWVGTNSGGLNRFDRNTETFVAFKNEQDSPQSLSFNNVETLFEDASFNLWVGTWGGGLNKLDRKPAKFEHYISRPNDSNSLCNNYVRTIAEEKSGILWVGTSGGGLDRIDRKTQKFVHYRYDPLNPNSLSSDDVRAIHIDSSGTLWVGTYGGGLNKIVVTPPHGGKAKPQLMFKHFRHRSREPNSLCDDHVWAVHEDRNGILWLGTSDGVSRFDPASESFVHYKHEPENPNSLSSNIVRAIHEDHDGDLWFGTYHGLNRFDPQSGKFTRYFHRDDDENSLSHNGVMAIWETEPGVLWLGTLGGGLNKFDVKKGTFEHFFENDGLPNSFVHAIVGTDDGQLWLSTNKGLSRFDDRLPDGQKFRNYDVHDGLQSNEFNVGGGVRGYSGELFFGGVNGFNCFRPDEIRENPYIPAVVITEFTIFNERALLKQAPGHRRRVELSYADRFFSFEFASLDYTNPSKNRYAYMMEGFDTDWIYAGTRRYASYTNLDPGEYVFRVKGTNNDGVWNETGTSVQVIITPPFWETWWFRTLAASGLLGLLGLFYHLRVSSLMKEKVAQERFSRQLIEVQEQERKRIASGLHDSLGQNLLIIKNSLEQTIHSASNKQDAPLQDLKELSVIASQSIEEVREISYNLHPHLIDRLGLTKALGSIVRKVRQSGDINISAEIDEIDALVTKESDIHIFRIIQEAVNNVVRHSQASEARIQVQQAGEMLHISISDNGGGFDFEAYLAEDSQHEGFGLAGIAERVKILKGEFHVDTSRQGTTLSIRIPLNEFKR